MTKNSSKLGVWDIQEQVPVVNYPTGVSFSLKLPPYNLLLYLKSPYYALHNIGNERQLGAVLILTN